MYKPSNLSLNWFTNIFLVLLTSLLQKKKNKNENKNDSKSLHNEKEQKKQYDIAKNKVSDVWVMTLWIIEECVDMKAEDTNCYSLNNFLFCLLKSDENWNIWV